MARNPTARERGKRRGLAASREAARQDRSKPEKRESGTAKRRAEKNHQAGRQEEAEKSVESFAEFIKVRANTLAHAAAVMPTTSPTIAKLLEEQGRQLVLATNRIPEEMLEIHELLDYDKALPSARKDEGYPAQIE